MAQPIQSGTQVADTPPHEVGFPPFATETYPTQLLWLALTFGALYYFMSRHVAPRLAGIVESRETTVARDLDMAAAAKERAQAAGEAYEKSLAEAKARAQALAQETRDSLAADADAQRKALEADLAERLAASEAAISARKAEAMGNVRSIAVDTAGAIIERLTGRAPAPGAVEAAVDAVRR